MKRLEGVAKTVAEMIPRRDPRLDHIVVYLLTNGAPREIIVQRALVEHFCTATPGEKDER